MKKNEMKSHELSSSFSRPLQILYLQNIILSVLNYSALQNVEVAPKHSASFMPTVQKLYTQLGKRVTV